MSSLKSRVPFNPVHPYRTVRPVTNKIIFLACEGCVTEEEYFKIISDLFFEVKNRIQFISVAEDAVQTLPKYRTPEQTDILSKVRPKQLVERINNFKLQKEDIYQFEKYPDDEFWIVCDVDDNWSKKIISPKLGKTYEDEWKDAIALCEENGYRYALSNPFFEVWLLLHYDTINESDKTFAVTDVHEYEKTVHFRKRLQALGVTLKKGKHISASDYNQKNIMLAVRRAKELHIDPNNLTPHYISSTVYLLIEQILKLLPNSSN